MTGSGYEVLDWLRCIHHLLVDASIDPPLNTITSRILCPSALMNENGILPIPISTAAPQNNSSWVLKLKLVRKLCVSGKLAAKKNSNAKAENDAQQKLAFKKKANI